MKPPVMKMPIGRAVLAAALACAGCAGDAPVPRSSPSSIPSSSPNTSASASLYQRVGGRAAIAAVVDDAIGNIAADPRINRRFASASVSHLQSNLVDLLCMRTGGPCTYRGGNMSAVHEGMHIHADEFDALIEDLARSLDKFNVPAREQREVLAILRQMKSAVIEH